MFLLQAGRMWFLIGRGVVLGWFLWNSQIVPLPTFDRAPYQLLRRWSVGIVFLTLIILMSQNRAASGLMNDRI
jgi:uncharacterized membrane protein